MLSGLPEMYLQEDAQKFRFTLRSAIIMPCLFQFENKVFWSWMIS